MKVFVSIDGVKGIEDTCKYVKDAVADAMETIAWTGALPIQTEAQILSPKLSGTNARSIHTETKERTYTRCTAQVGPHTPYGRRLELGFEGPDALGRVYHQPARPYMRPAYDTKSEQGIKDMKEVAAFTIRQSLIEAANSVASRRNQRLIREMNR